MHAARKQSPKSDPIPWRLVHVTQGECIVLADPSRALATVLGSCISACVRDPGTGIGGMNHFLLASDLGGPDGVGSLRYGVNAMEALMNQVSSRAAVPRASLEIKVFGGANVQAGLGAVGHRNAEFIEEFMKREGLKLAASHLRGQQARKIVYHPSTGRVLMRYAQAIDARELVAAEHRLAQKVAHRPPADDDVELFG